MNKEINKEQSMENNRYALIDSGEGRKLEKFGPYILSRPDPEAIWKRSLGEEKWDKADAVFESESRWNFRKKLPESWIVEIENLKFQIGLSNFKHTGVFPEHKDNWKWVENQIGGEKLKILNLFAYTGGYTLAAAKAGGEVTHVDSSKFSVSRAKENAELSGLKDAPIRYIVDDALAYLKRELNRGNKYDGIILDPPSFGRGLKGQVWKIQEDLLPLLELCRKVLTPEPSFILLNGYAAGFSKEAYAEVLSSVFEIPLAQIERGELFIKEESGRDFFLPAGIFARWSRKH